MSSPSPQHPALLTESDLMAWLGIKQRSKLVGWCLDNGVPYRMVRGKVCTTVDCVNQGLGLGSGAENDTVFDDE